MLFKPFQSRVCVSVLTNQLSVSCISQNVKIKSVSYSLFLFFSCLLTPNQSPKSKCSTFFNRLFFSAYCSELGIILTPTRIISVHSDQLCYIWLAFAVDLAALDSKRCGGYADRWNWKGYVVNTEETGADPADGNARTRPSSGWPSSPGDEAAISGTRSVCKTSLRWGA